jgi:hypothetical protein
VIDLTEPAAGQPHPQAVEDQLVATTVLGALAPADADLLRAHYVEGHPLAVIAERLGTTAGTVKVMLHRSRQRARAIARDHGLPGLTIPGAETIRRATPYTGQLGEAAAYVLATLTLGAVLGAGGLGPASPQLADAAAVPAAVEGVMTDAVPATPGAALEGVAAAVPPVDLDPALTAVDGAVTAVDDRLPDYEAHRPVVHVLDDGVAVAGTTVGAQGNPDRRPDYVLYDPVGDLSTQGEVSPEERPVWETACQVYEAGEPVTRCERR